MNDQKARIHARCDYFDVYLRYWEHYHYRLALSGLAANRNRTIVAYGGERLMRLAREIHARFASGAGASAQIAAGSIDTINILFSNLGRGGFFVNGQENILFDAATGTGFLVNGQPAVAGVNFFVTYGAPAPPTTITQTVNQAIDQVIAATNQVTETVTEQQEQQTQTGAVSDEKKEEEKKKEEAQACR